MCYAWGLDGYKRSTDLKMRKTYINSVIVNEMSVTVNLR